MPFEYWFYCAVLQQSVQYGNVFMHCLHYVAKLKQVWVFLYGFLTQMEEKKISIACFSFRLCWKKVSSFYVCSICLRNLLFKLKRMKKNVKQKAGFCWKCVLKSMFILLFTRINNEQSSIVSKISIYWATHVTIYFIL